MAHKTSPAKDAYSITRTTRICRRSFLLGKRNLGKRILGTLILVAIASAAPAQIPGVQRIPVAVFFTLY
jgi:hypothetical protein